MKTKKLGKKLSLSKITVANLEQNQQRVVKAGYAATELGGDCNSWYPACWTQPAYACQTVLTTCEVCLETYKVC